MTPKNLFRLVVGLSLAFSIASAVAGSFPGDITEDWKIVLEWSGNEGVSKRLLESIPESNLSRVGILVGSILFLAIVAAVEIGMFMFWRFARTGYLLLTIAFVLLVPFDGLVVMAPLQTTLYEVALILDGAIIAMAYLQPVRGYFELALGVVMTTTQVAETTRPGITGAIAVIYILYGIGFLIAIAMGGTIRGVELGWPDAWFPVLVLVAAIGILRRARWGRWLGYVVSVPLLLGVPIGTLLGGYMVWHLTKYRASFSRAY